jgi:hypothetical protein
VASWADTSRTCLFTCYYVFFVLVLNLIEVSSRALPTTTYRHATTANVSNSIKYMHDDVMHGTIDDARWSMQGLS